MVNMHNDYKCILLDLLLTVTSIFCVRTSTVQFSGASKRTPFTHSLTQRVKITSQPATVITSQTRALYRALTTGTTQAHLARRHVQLATFGVLRPVLFPLNASACVIVHYTKHFYRTLSCMLLIRYPAAKLMEVSGFPPSFMTSCFFGR
jgi:hypothetical protein